MRKNFEYMRMAPTMVEIEKERSSAYETLIDRTTKNSKASLVKRKCSEEKLSAISESTALEEHVGKPSKIIIIRDK